MNKEARTKNRPLLMTALVLAILLVIVAAALLVFMQGPTDGEPSAPRSMILATTTSTYDSGLLDAIIPDFEERHNAEVQILSVGTGQALRTGEAGDADVVLVHAPASEKKFIEEGHGIDRRCVMYNDFIILGPEDDPASIRGSTAVGGLSAIASERAEFISRGDDSGTHKKEQLLWAAVSVTREGGWYQEVGAGMGDTIRIANEKQAYTLADRGTYLAFKDKIDLAVLVEGDPLLINQYGVMRVNPAKGEAIAADVAEDFSDWLMSDQTQDMIADFRKGGEQLFRPLRGECVAG